MLKSNGAHKLASLNRKWYAYIMTNYRMGKLPENYSPREEHKRDMAEMRADDKIELRKMRRKAWKRFLRFFR